MVNFSSFNTTSSVSTVILNEINKRVLYVIEETNDERLILFQ